MSAAWWITLNTFLIFIMLTGGFFMFRAFLRKMKPSPSSTDENKQTNRNS